MKTTWTEFGRKEGESDEDWAKACKEMAAFLQSQLDEKRKAASDAPKED